MRFTKNLIISMAIALTAMAAFNGVSTYRIAKRSSEEILKSTAYFIGITLDNALERTGIDEGLIIDIMKSQAWENIAFIAMYDRYGAVLLHSSKRLIGQTQEISNIEQTLERGRPAGSYLTLKTGELVYVMDIPIFVHSISEKRYLLRVALHTYPAQVVVRSAQMHALLQLLILLALWALTAFVLYYIRRMERLQETARQNERFALLGEMAAVLAHEIRSPLSAIKGFAQYIEEKVSHNEQLSEGAGIIIAESQRLETLTEDLLVYARPPVLQKQRFSISALVDEIHGLYEKKFGSITINKRISLNNDIVLSDKEKLKQIMINIIQNAIDSTVGTGSIDISVLEKSDNMFIIIKDSGTGMDADTLKNALKPFYTTKVRGTGLGLSIVNNLVTMLGGTVAIDSAPNAGTTVTVSLPRVK
ncbi:MAG: GHKL domain-containing protein [Nitrospirae bacterium]|nr:GHKL domain-containing protein [Nitrospirota bacterium]